LAEVRNLGHCIPNPDHLKATCVAPDAIAGAIGIILMGIVALNPFSGQIHFQFHNELTPILDAQIRVSSSGTVCCIKFYPYYQGQSLTPCKGTRF
jgi:hypothetical protein